MNLFLKLNAFEEKFAHINVATEPTIAKVSIKKLAY